MIENIRKRVEVGDYRITIHAFERCVERSISPVYGITEAKRILHVQCSIDPVWIITAYDPTLNPDRWDKDFKRRRII